MHNRMTKRTLIALFLSLTACGGTASSADDHGSPTDRTFLCEGQTTQSWCPVDSTCLPSGGCWSAATGYEMTDAGCNPVACQSYFDWSIYLHGGQCPGFCASACQAACAEEARVEQGALDDATAAGCPPCRY
jgi:hypothetical protein